MPTKILWEEWGNKTRGTGSITRSSIPLHWYLLDIWLERVHERWAKIPGWHKFWSWLIPDWGDPFCAAYCFPWSNFYWRKRKEELNIEVGFDKLSDEMKNDEIWNL